MFVTLIVKKPNHMLKIKNNISNSVKDDSNTSCKEKPDGNIEVVHDSNSDNEFPEIYTIADIKIIKQFT